MRTIRWNTAVEMMSIAPKIQIEVSIPKKKEDVLEEIKSTHLECLDARDVNMYAADAKITPNEVRDLMIQPNSGNNNEDFIALMNSFDEDDTDSLIGYFS